MRLYRLGIFLVGFGETIADVGARIAGTRRLRSELYPRPLTEYQDGVPYAPPVQDRRTDGSGWPD